MAQDSIVGQRSVLIVEDERLLADLIARALERHGFNVRWADNAADAARMCQQFDPDALVLDINLGPGPNGFELAEALLSKGPGRAVIFLTNLPDARFSEYHAEKVLSQAVYLHKNRLASIEDLVYAVEFGLRGNVYEVMRHDLDGERPLAKLSRNQLAVLRLMAKGSTNQQIAEMRGTTVRAVEAIISRLFLALDINPESTNPRVEAVKMYIEAAGID